LKIKDFFSLLSETTWWVVLAVITAGSLLGAYVFHRDARLLEPRIAIKQGELARVMELRDLYVSKRSGAEKVAAMGTEPVLFSLGLLEDLIKKSFTGGRLILLRPFAAKGERMGARGAAELKVSGATVSETIDFARALKSAGLVVRKLQLNLPQGQSLLDMYLVVSER
jgi:hypothetical protein